MRKSIESLLVWFVPISLLAFAAGSIGFAFQDTDAQANLASALGLSLLNLKVYIKLSQSLLFAASNLAAGVWLAFRPQLSVARRSLWSLFGLTSGLWAVIIWILVQLYEQRTAADS